MLLALATAAVIALVAIGGDDSSKATADAPATVSGTRSPSAASVTSSPAPSAGPTSASKSPGETAGTTRRAGMRSHTVTRPPKIYTVKPGDTLSDIAQWFDLRGYRPLYDWNKTVVGQNPDLIFPGQRVVVVPGGPVSVRNG